jgi:hypothetical protein
MQKIDLDSLAHILEVCLSDEFHQDIFPMIGDPDQQYCSKSTFFETLICANYCIELEF